VTPADGLLRVVIPPLSGGATLDDVSARFVDDAGQVPWTIHGATVDPRVLEDRPTRVVSSGSADVTVRHRDGRTIYHQRVATATVPFAGTLVPLSRAKPCRAPDDALVGCPLTDGDLTTRTDLSGPVTVDLGAPTPVGLVIVRGSTGIFDAEGLRIEGSDDGTRWLALRPRPLDGDLGWSAAAPGGSTPSFRYLRASNGKLGLDLAEISVWAPTAADRAAASPLSPAGPGGPGGDDDSPLPKALAAGLVVAVGAGLLVTRRRRT
jgi:hypothetical protein